MLNLEVKGVNRVANPIRSTVSRFPNIADDVLANWARSERGALKSEPYPAERPGQTYVRTGNLANRWSAIRVAVAKWSLTNSAPYAVFVIGDEKGGGQAWMHVDRWWTARAKIEEATPDLVRALTAAYEEALAPD